MKACFCYIDPSTGSMLFAVLMGIIGALSYMIKSWSVKLRFILSRGKKIEVNDQKIPLVIFSDDKRYWNVFKPVCRELDSRGIDVVYMTASSDDPALDNDMPHVSAEFIGEGNRAYARLGLLNAKILLSTTPGLDVYQWKRSKNVDFYIHMLHAANDVAAYRMFGIDYYDAILLSGEYQVSDVRELEKIRNLPAKELVKVGIPYMDDMRNRLEEDLKNENIGAEAHNRTVLLAPSWGASSLFNVYGSELIDALINTGYNIIIRPHPQSYTAEADLISNLKRKYPDSEKICWNRDNDNYDVLKKSDILISDYSGVFFDFSLVYDKPIIYSDFEYDSSPYDIWWLNKPLWTHQVLPQIGRKLDKDNISDIKNIIDECIEDPGYAKARDEVRSQTWEHMGEGAVRVADYIVEKLEK